MYSYQLSSHLPRVFIPVTPILLPQVHVEFTDKQGGVKLEGPPEEVEICREKLETMIADLRGRLCFEQISVDPK